MEVMDPLSSANSLIGTHAGRPGSQHQTSFAEPCAHQSHSSVLRQRRRWWCSRSLPRRQHDDGCHQGKTDRRRKEYRGDDRQDGAREQGCKANADCAPCDDADDSNDHSLGEREAEQSLRSPTRRSEYSLLTRAITKIDGQDVGDAEGTEQERQHRGDEIDATDLHAHQIAEHTARYLTLKDQLHREQRCERGHADQQAERSAHDPSRAPKTVGQRDAGHTSNRTVRTAATSNRVHGIEWTATRRSPRGRQPGSARKDQRDRYDE